MWKKETKKQLHCVTYGKMVRTLVGSATRERRGGTWRSGFPFSTGWLGSALFWSRDWVRTWGRFGSMRRTLWLEQSGWREEQQDGGPRADRDWMWRPQGTCWGLVLRVKWEVVEGGCGLDCVPQKKMLTSQPLEPVDVTWFGIRVLQMWLVKMRSHCLR